MIDLTMFRADGRCPYRGKLYGLYDRQRERWEIVRDHAEAHELTARQVEALVAELPGGGANVVNIKDYRK
jgi:hypothetical protein